MHTKIPNTLGKIAADTKAFSDGQKRASSQKTQDKIALMWRNHIVPRYLLKYGHSNVLGKDWDKYSDPIQTMRMGYKKIPESKRIAINNILELYFEVNEGAVRVPKEEWEHILFINTKEE